MNRKEAGFTLIELVITMAILSILLSLALPSFQGVLARQRVSSAIHLLSTDMAMARSTAVMRREAVVVCPLGADGTCGTDSDWGAGWMVFRDPDGNREPDEQSRILRLTDAPASGRLTLSSTRGFLRYQPDGRAAHSNLTVRVCADGLLAGKVVVNNLGRVRSERPRPAVCPES